MRKHKIFKIVVMCCICIATCCFSFVCANTQGDYLNGAYKTGEYYGVKGNIECDPVTVSNGSYAYLMLGDYVGSNTYLKIGWGKSSGQSQNWNFYELRNTFSYVHEDVSVAPTGTHSYEISDNGNGAWNFKVNGTTVDSYVIYDSDVWPDHAGFFGEVLSSSDQNPGTTSDPLSMGYLKVKNAAGNWINATFTTAGIKDLSTQKNNSSTGSYSFEQWDSRY